MKNRWVMTALVLSLAFNFTFLGALGYRLWEKKRNRRPAAEQTIRREGPPREGHLALRKDQKERLDKLRKEFFPKLREIRKQLEQERKDLGTLMLKEKTDTVEIVKRLDRVGELQTRIEKMVVFQMLKESESMDPRQRELYIKMIIRRLGERQPGNRENQRRNPVKPDDTKPKQEKQP